MAAATFQTSHPNSTPLSLVPINMASKRRHATVDTHTREDHVKTPLLHGNRIPWQPMVWGFFCGLGEREESTSEREGEVEGEGG